MFSFLVWLKNNRRRNVFNMPTFWRFGGTPKRILRIVTHKNFRLNQRWKAAFFREEDQVTLSSMNTREMQTFERRPPLQLVSDSKCAHSAASLTESSAGVDKRCLLDDFEERASFPTVTSSPIMHLDWRILLYWTRKWRKTLEITSTEEWGCSK
jgi:hypothetical protein